MKGLGSYFVIFSGSLSVKVCWLGRHIMLHTFTSTFLSFTATAITSRCVEIKISSDGCKELTYVVTLPLVLSRVDLCLLKSL